MLSAYRQITMYYRPWLALVFILIRATCSGHEGSASTYGVSGRLSYGFLIAHREALMPLQDGHLRAAEIAVFRTSTSQKDWENKFLLPETGLQLEVIDPGTSELGTVVAAYPFIDFVLNGSGNRSWWLRYGMGIGYVSNIFDAENNYKNAAIGSHVNGVLHVDLHYREPIGKKSVVEIGVGLTHLSNGSARMPNLGVNFPKIDLGYRRYFGEPSTAPTQRASPERTSHSWECYLAGAFKETYPVMGRKYAAGTFNLLYRFSSERNSTFGIGTDLFYDQSLSPRYERITGKSNPAADYRGGIYGSWQMRIGAMDIGFNIGCYPYSIYRSDGFVYHRVGLKYHFKRFFLCSNLKTHYARADFFEWGAGYSFN